MRLVALLILLTIPAHADPAPADRRKLAGFLRKGRELQGSRRYAEAVATFEESLKLAPDDPTVLGELGWTAYLMKDLAKAREATQKAIAHEAAPNIRGATFYNLGLIEEARGDKPAAVAAYAESLRARPNATVRAALKQLDAKAAEPFDPYLPVALAGPFPSVAAYCKTLPASHADPEGTFECACVDVPDGTRKLTAPFEKLQVFKRGCGYDQSSDGFAKFGFIDYKLAVKVASGWFVATVGNSRLIGHGGEWFKLAGAKPQPIGGTPGLVVEYTIDGTYSHRMVSNDWKRTEVAVIGLGASGVPSATPPIARKRLEIDEYDDSGPKRTVDVSLDLTWGGDGTLGVAATKTTGLDKATAGDLIGKHRLVFP